MRLSRSTILATMLAALFAHATGAPLQEHNTRHLAKREVQPNTQSCHATDEASNVVFYNVDIGLGFGNGVGCDAIENALGGVLSSQGFGNYQCEDDGGGFTLIIFSVFQATGNGAKINTAFQAVTNNAIQGGFNCPDF